MNVLERNIGRPVDWSALAQKQFVFEDQCWTTCGGGFCCSSDHPDFDFKLLPRKGTTLIYMEREYAHMNEREKTFENGDDKRPAYKLEFSFRDDKATAIYHTFCGLLGKCNGIVDKPLLCRLYPFIPVLDLDGKLYDVVEASVLDLTFAAIGKQSPCTVLHRRRDAYLDRWRKNDEDIDSLRHPYIMFHLEAVRRFGRIYVEKLKSSDLIGREGADFWRQWELPFLSGKLIDVEKLRAEMAEVYQSYERRFGDFL